jgi:hypothetical protein
LGDYNEIVKNKEGTIKAKKITKSNFLPPPPQKKGEERSNKKLFRLTS